MGEKVVAVQSKRQRHAKVLKHLKIVTVSGRSGLHGVRALAVVMVAKRPGTAMSPRPQEAKANTVMLWRRLR